MLLLMLRRGKGWGEFFIRSQTLLYDCSRTDPTCEAYRHNSGLFTQHNIFFSRSFFQTTT